MDGTSHPAIVALSAALEDISNMFRVPVGDVGVLAIHARDWADSCLELPAGTDGCANVITPAYEILLGDGFRYHTDQSGNIRRVSDAGSV